MKKSLLSVALAASALPIAPSASAITFPSLTTIYVGTGVHEDGPSESGATIFHCSNVSGVSTSVRFLVLNSTGAVAASTTQTLAHGATVTVSTDDIDFYANEIDLNANALDQGVVNIEALQSGVFCNAMSVNGNPTDPNGFTLPLVRVNPHPGTVE
jgi:hypothetical protein